MMPSPLREAHAAASASNETSTGERIDAEDTLPWPSALQVSVRRIHGAGMPGSRSGLADRAFFFGDFRGMPRKVAKNRTAATIEQRFGGSCRAPFGELSPRRSFFRVRARPRTAH